MAKKEKKNELKIFTVQGKINAKSGEKNFTKELNAFNPNNAAERTMTQFGSKNKIKRRDIQITEIKEKK